jgi:hypothetical protein
MPKGALAGTVKPAHTAKSKHSAYRVISHLTPFPPVRCRRHHSQATSRSSITHTGHSLQKYLMKIILT